MVFLNQAARVAASVAATQPGRRHRATRATQGGGARSKESLVALMGPGLSRWT